MEKNQLKKRMTNSKGSFYLLAFISILFSVFAFVACSPSGGGSSDSSSSETPATTTSNEDPVITLGLGGSQNSRIMSTYQDIASVNVQVTRNADNSSVNTFALDNTSTGAWTGTLSGLQVGLPYNFYVTADNSTNQPIFEGSQLNKSLAAGSNPANNLSLTMTPVGYSTQTDIPRILRITRPEYLNSNQVGPINVLIDGGETYGFAPPAYDNDSTVNAGAYSILGGATGTAGVTTVSANYTAPNVISNFSGITRHEVKVVNATGNSISSSYTITTDNRSRNIYPTLAFAPSITGLHATIMDNGTNVRIEWLADVSDDNTSLTYAWTGTGAFHSGVDNLTADATTNPTYMDYNPATGGTIQLTVSDGANNTVITYNMPAYQFPAQLISGITPEVRKAYPSRDGTTSPLVSLADNITINFSHVMTPVNSTTIFIKQDSNGAVISGGLDNFTVNNGGASDGDFQVRFNPSAPLITGVTYRVVIDSTLTNIYDEPLTPDNRSCTFTAP